MDAALMAPRRKRKEAARAVAADDVILDILSRVAADDLATLFRCAVTCKHRRSLVADPSFLRRLSPEGARHPSPLLGVFGRQKNSDGSWVSGPPTFISATRSPLPGCCVGPRTVGLLDKAVPLVSRQGLLLVRLAPRGREQTGLHLALCHMFADTCDVLPPLEGVFYAILGSAILTDADCCGSNQGPSQSSSRYSNTFKVLVIIEADGTSKFEHNLYSFSSLESSWSAPRKSSDLTKSTVFHSDIAVCRGKAHWLVRDFDLFWNLYTFDLSNETTIHVCFTKVSIPRHQLEFNYYNRPRLNVTIDGNLSMLSLRPECYKLDIWTHQGEDKESGDRAAADWVRTRVIELKPKVLHLDELACICLCWISDTVLILDQSQLMHIVNLKTEVIDAVPDQFCSLRRWSIVPVEMDWPAFFMSRLEAKTQGKK